MEFCQISNLTILLIGLEFSLTTVTAQDIKEGAEIQSNTKIHSYISEERTLRLKDLII
jgi:hypothetical protein